MLRQIWNDIVWLLVGWKLYLQLARLAKRNKIDIVWSTVDNGMDGLFFPDYDMSPARVEIFVGDCRDIVDICVTLAHELGHHASWQQYGYNAVLDDALCKLHAHEPMTSEQKAELLLEEAIAWDFAHELFDDFARSRFTWRMREKMRWSGQFYRETIQCAD